MKFSVKNLSSVKKMVNIEIPEKTVKQTLDTAYTKLKKTAKIKGFRPGKTPRSILEKLHGKTIDENVSSELVQNALSEVISKTKFNFIGAKKISTQKPNPAKPYIFNAEIEIKPEIDDINLDGLILKKTIYKISDKEIDTQLNMLQKSMAKQEIIKEKRSAKSGDFVSIDYEISQTTDPSNKIEKSKNFLLQIGKALISQKLDTSIIGMMPEQEKIIPIKFTNNHHYKKLSGLDTIFKIKLNEIRIEILPEIDDKLAKKIGSLSSLNELKNKIAKNLQQGYDKRTEQELNEQIFIKIIEKTDFELPELLIQRELATIISDTERSLNYHNKSLEDAGLTREILEKKYKTVAEKQVRRKLILNKLVEQIEPILSEDVLEKEFKEMASMYNRPIEEIKTFYNQNSDKLEILKHALLEKQTIDIIINNSKIDEIMPSESCQTD